MNNRFFVKFCVSAFLALSTIFLNGQIWEVSQIKNDVYVLASDSLEGRLVGSEGEKKAAAYIANRFKEIGLEPLYDNSDYFFPFTHQLKRFDGQDSVDVLINGVNVVGFVNNDAEHTIFIGAHYDHLGYGEYGNSKATKKDNLPHYGADDNASGVAGVLALAHHFSNEKRIEERFNYIFACFSGEEIGLIGSKDFVKNKLRNKENISFMINFDMIGKFSEDKKLTTFGVGSAEEWVDLLKNVNNQGFNFNLILDSSGIGPSDHTSFYLAKIPVLYFHTGSHSDYHKPSDSPDKINYEGIDNILRFVARFIDIVYYDNLIKPTYRETKNTMVSRPKFNVTLGIMPDYSYQEGGIKIDGVIEGRPAMKAGLLENDIILEIGDFKIHSMKEYMQVLSHYHKGDSVMIIYTRAGKTMKTTLNF
jgi:hypothetical protein